MKTDTACACTSFLLTADEAEGILSGAKNLDLDFAIRSAMDAAKELYGDRRPIAFRLMVTVEVDEDEDEQE